MSDTLVARADGREDANTASSQNDARLLDAKRLRKSFLRRTIDYNSPVVRYMQCRPFFAMKDMQLPQPDPNFIIDLLPPSAMHHAPANAMTTKFIHTSKNKHLAYVNVVRWTPEGRRLVAGSASGEFTLWNGLTFNFETIMQAHDTSVRVMKWSHNDTWLLSGDNGGNVKYWQSNLNNLKLVQAHKEAVRGVTFSPSDSKFATCSDDKTIKIWNFNEGICESVLTGHGWDVKCIDWHPHKSLLASGSKDNLIKLWDPRMGKQLTTIHGHKNTIHSLQWNKNGNWLLSGARDQLVKLFDIRMMKELMNFRGHPKEVCSVAWHPQQEQLFVSGGSDGSLLWWMANNLKPLASVLNAHEANIWAMDWHPLGHILCTGSNDYYTRFWSRSRPGETSAASNAKNDTSATSVQGEDGNQFYLPGFGTIGLSDEYEDEDRNGVKSSVTDKSGFEPSWKKGNSQGGPSGQTPHHPQSSFQPSSHSQHGGRGSPYQRPRENNDRTHHNRNNQQYQPPQQQQQQYQQQQHQQQQQQQSPYHGEERHNRGHRDNRNHPPDPRLRGKEADNDRDMFGNQGKRRRDDDYGNGGGNNGSNGRHSYDHHQRRR